MHREPTKRKLPLSTLIPPRAARSAPGSQSTAHRPLPSQRADAASARVWRRRPEADCAGSGHGGPERQPLTAARGQGSGRRPGRERATHRSGRARRPHPGAPAARQDGPGRRSHREGESASPPVPYRPLRLPERAHSRFLRTQLGDPSSARCPARPPPPSPATSPSSPFSPPPSPQPPPNGKYLPGRGAMGARLSEGQPTVTNSKRSSGEAGFLVANPKACRRRPKEEGREQEGDGPGVKEVRPLGCAQCAAAILESGSCDGGRVRPEGKGRSQSGGREAVTWT